MTISDRPIVDLKIDSRLRSDGYGHIKVWVTFIVRSNGEKKWKQRPYKTNQFCTPSEFDMVTDTKGYKDQKLSTRLKDIRREVFRLKAYADSICDNYNTQEGFESRFLSQYGANEIAAEFELKIAELKAAKKISSAEKYETAINSLKEFYGKDVAITYEMLTPEELQRYEDWYISQPIKKGAIETKSLTSVGINMRNTRHIFKRAIKKGITTAYPFGMNAYVIPEGGDDTKKFMLDSERIAFINWEPKDEKLKELHDYALFSYFGFGMNMSDVARLRKTKLFPDYLTIDRQKTKGRKKKKKVTVVPLHGIMQEIIQRRSRKSLIPDDFVFPILEYGSDEETMFYRIRDFVDDVNDMLAVMAKELKFDFKPTSYTLRHTFAFNAMQLGATTEELQDFLSHGSKQTTENYKHGFTLDRKKKFSDGLGK